MKTIVELKEDALRGELVYSEFAEYVSVVMNYMIRFADTFLPVKEKVVIEEEKYSLESTMVKGSHEFNTKTKECTIILYRDTFIQNTMTLLREPLSPTSVKQYLMASVLYTYLHENGHGHETRTSEDFTKKAIYFRQGTGLYSIIDLEGITSYKKLIYNKTFLNLLIESRKYVVDTELFADKFVVDILNENGLEAYVDYFNSVPDFIKTEEYYSVYSYEITRFIAGQIVHNHFSREGLNIDEVLYELDCKALQIEGKTKKEVRI